MRSDREKFDSWLKTAGIGNRYVYNEGSVPGPLAGHVRDCAEKGLVALFQKRLGEFRFAYMAIRITEKTAKLLSPRWSEE